MAVNVDIKGYLKVMDPYYTNKVKNHQVTKAEEPLSKLSQILLKIFIL